MLNEAWRRNPRKQSGAKSRLERDRSGRTLRGCLRVHKVERHAIPGVQGELHRCARRTDRSACSPNALAIEFDNRFLETHAGAGAVAALVPKSIAVSIAGGGAACTAVRWPATYPVAVSGEQHVGVEHRWNLSVKTPGRGVPLGALDITEGEIAGKASTRSARAGVCAFASPRSWPPVPAGGSARPIRGRSA